MSGTPNGFTICCPTCGQPLIIGGEHLGQTTFCPRCGVAFLVPGMTEPTPPPVSEPDPFGLNLGTSPTSRPAQKQPARGAAWIIAGAIVFTGVGALGVLVTQGALHSYLPRNSPTEPTNSQSSENPQTVSHEGSSAPDLDRLSLAELKELVRQEEAACAELGPRLIQFGMTGGSNRLSYQQQIELERLGGQERTALNMRASVYQGRKDKYLNEAEEKTFLKAAYKSHAALAEAYRNQLAFISKCLSGR